MDESFARKTNLFGAWCMVAYIMLLLIGWMVVAGFVPFHLPSASADQIATIISNNVNRIRCGMILVMWGAAVFIPVTATMADFVARFEGRSGPLTRITTMAGYANAMRTFYPPLWWIMSTWRVTERSADTARLLNDMAWLQFVGGVSLVTPMLIVMALVAFNDKDKTTSAFPRWFGYQSIMTFMLLLPDQMLFFFKSGPFGWNGIVGGWIPVAVFCGWLLTTFYLMRRALLRGDTVASEPRVSLPV